MGDEIIISDEKKERLKELEAVIERDIQGFMRVGAALKEIKEQGLYRAKYELWEEYCKKEWDFGKAYVRYQMRATEVVQVLSSQVHHGVPFEILPANERQVRPLVPFDADLQRGLWQSAIMQANQDNNGKVTGAIVNKVVKEYLASKTSETIDQIIGPEPENSNEPYRMSEKFDKGFRGFLKQVEEAINTEFKTTSRAAVLAALDSVRDLIEPVQGEQQN